MELLVEHVSHAFGSLEVLDDVSFGVASGEVLAVVGPSGCGKSTLLNAIAGFDTVTAGQIHLDGRLLAQPGLAPQPGPDRVVVFQHGALLLFSQRLLPFTVSASRCRSPFAPSSRITAGSPPA